MKKCIILLLMIFGLFEIAFSQKVYMATLKEEVSTDFQSLVADSIEYHHKVTFNNKYALLENQKEDCFLFTRNCVYYYKYVNPNTNNGYEFEKILAAKCGDVRDIQWEYTGITRMIRKHLCKEILLTGNDLILDSLYFYVSDSLPYFNTLGLNLDFTGFIMEYQYPKIVDRKVFKTTYYYEFHDSTILNKFNKITDEFNGNFMFTNMLFDTISKDQLLDENIVKKINQEYLPSTSFRSNLERSTWGIGSRPDSNIVEIQKFNNEDLEFKYSKTGNSVSLMDFQNRETDTTKIIFNYLGNPISISSNYKIFDIVNDTIWRIDKKSGSRACYFGNQDSGKITAIHYEDGKKTYFETFNTNERIDSFIYNLKSSEKQIYSYDKSGQLIRKFRLRNNKETKGILYNYYPNGLVKEVIEGGWKRKFTYSLDLASNKSSLFKVVINNNGSLSSELLEFDNMGNLIRKEKYHGAGKVNSKTFKYIYN